MIKKSATLIPVAHTTKRGVSYEQILMKVDGYPAAMFHIDTLWDGSSTNDVYSKLSNGTSVNCMISIEPIDENLVL